MIDREHDLPLTRQAILVGLSRGAIYYEPRPLPESDLRLMRRMDELHLEHPFAGSRMLRDLLNLEGHRVGQTCRLPDAADGNRGDLPQEEHQPAAPGSSDVSVFAAAFVYRSTQPSLGQRHHLHPDGARLCVSRRRDRLVHAQSTRLAAV
jgi:hypothetical protein